MSHSYILAIFYLLMVQGKSRTTTIIDTESDLPTNGHWVLDCPQGYAANVKDFNCGAFNGGTVEIPSEQLNGEIGFWTVCSYLCHVKYFVQPDDTIFSARVYLSNMTTEVVYDGRTTGFIKGSGWVNFHVDLENEKHTDIELRFNHFSKDVFSLLDKVVVNGELVLPTTSTEPSGSTSQTTSVETDSSTSSQGSTTFSTEYTAGSTSQTSLETTPGETDSSTSSQGTTIVSTNSPISSTTSNEVTSPVYPSTETTEKVTTTDSTSTNTLEPITSDTSSIPSTTDYTNTRHSTSSEETTSSNSESNYPSTGESNQPTEPTLSTIPSSSNFPETPSSTSTSTSSFTSSETSKTSQDPPLGTLPTEKNFIEQTWPVFLASFFSTLIFLSISFVVIFFVYPKFHKQRVSKFHQVGV